ncbi:DUF6864 domain-containing function [Crenobacter cavernae]|uniref:DUF6864 domain-containing function n=1 Tax=Crenobacter cavernae TaxID=2290923 RepID=UPI0011C05FA4|nr:hypothetical protein [Crenobacter cavernae]
MKIFCGEFEVYESGTLTSPDLSDTKFVISESPLMEIVFRISMGEGEPGISLEALGESTLAMVFKKPTGIGYGPAIPVKVGNLNGRALYVSFRASMRGENSSYGLEYTFYLKEAV